MPIGAGLGAAIGGASSLISGLFGSGSARNEARLQRKENRYLAEYSYQKDLEQWNRSNAYNDPKAQMERLKNAGLNPNLMYGNGASTSVGNTSVETPKYQRPEVPRASLKLELPNMLSMLSQYTDIQNKGLQGNLLKTQDEALQKELGLKDIKGEYDKQKTLLTMSQRSDLDNTIGYKIKRHEANLKKDRASANIINKDWERYKKTNISPNSPWQAKLIEGLFTKYIQKYLK